MVVLPFTGASCYHNCCKDGNTSTENFGSTHICYKRDVTYVSHQTQLETNRGPIYVSHQMQLETNRGPIYVSHQMQSETNRGPIYVSSDAVGDQQGANEDRQEVRMKHNLQVPVSSVLQFHNQTVLLVQVRTCEYRSRLLRITSSTYSSILSETTWC